LCSHHCKKNDENEVSIIHIIGLITSLLYSNHHKSFKERFTIA